MIGSIDCMHWEWKNCPTAWKCQYSRGSRKPTIVLEAVASYDLWIWHAFFGPQGTLNDINVLDRSPVFDDIINGRAPKSISRSTEESTIWLTISPMVFIKNGQLLSNLFQYLKGRKQFYLRNVKKLSEKMSSVLSEFCKLDLPLLKIQHFLGIKSRLGRL